MTVPIVIWTVFSVIEAFAAIAGSDKPVKPNVVTFGFWIASVLLLVNGYNWAFFALNIMPALLLFVLGGFDLLVSPPGSDTSRPQMYIASGIIRTAFIVACCYTN